MVDRDLKGIPKAPPKCTLTDEDAQEAREAGEWHVCDQCPTGAVRAFMTRAALVQHCVRCHGQRNLFQSVVRDHVCPMCGKAYGTRRRAVDH